MIFLDALKVINRSFVPNAVRKWKYSNRKELLLKWWLIMVLKKNNIWNTAQAHIDKEGSSFRMFMINEEFYAVPKLIQCEHNQIKYVVLNFYYQRQPFVSWADFLFFIFYFAKSRFNSRTDIQADNCKANKPGFIKWSIMWCFMVFHRTFNTA